MGKKDTPSKLPATGRPLRLDPDLAKAINAELAPLKGDKLAKAQEAVVHVYHSGVTGMYADIVAAYRRAIQEAVAA